MPENVKVSEVLYVAYANLAMAHSAVERKQNKYTAFNFMIRSRLLNGLKNGTMNMRSIFDDEKIKLQTGQVCNYCGAAENLTLDHVFPKRYGGEDDADNLVYACRLCNSSKGKKDLMEWMTDLGRFLPLMIIRRYLKLTVVYCRNNELLDKYVGELTEMELPFKIEFLPISYPAPGELKLSAGNNTGNS